MSSIGAVIIGRNEGDRLVRSLRSVVAEGLTAVYVDSGSSDRSVANATAANIETVELDPSRPFSAARARNEGVDRLLEVAPDCEMVMILDGDCELVSGFVARAARSLAENPAVAVVCGRRTELDPDRSIYNRMADIEWDTPVGYAAACGGDSLMRLSAFREVGGFDPLARAGEEPELCQRLHSAGWSVLRIDAKMTRHDLAMTRFGQWWKRQFRVGYNGLDIQRIHRRRVEGSMGDRSTIFDGSLRRARIWGVGWPVASLVGFLTLSGRWGWRVGFVFLAAMVGLLVLQVARVGLKNRRRFRSIRDALKYGLLMLIEKWANLAGQIQYGLDRRHGRATRLVEYKTGEMGEDLGASRSAAFSGSRGGG